MATRATTTIAEQYKGKLKTALVKLMTTAHLNENSSKSYHAATVRKRIPIWLLRKQKVSQSGTTSCVIQSRQKTGDPCVISLTPSHGGVAVISVRTVIQNVLVEKAIALNKNTVDFSVLFGLLLKVYT
ncbi:hypothetical protein PHMEG_00024481 [Phytophthora megakarya]|uniref:Uncharacterized protein n=1 Tax=Phytophthora megakarya TaxID=4795 RepID=A0A225VG44_9STRA|nr:hypothetical protein PHMEG_00024481 [Phytophthora megakarya]